MYQLISRDLTHLGGPMGSEYTTDTTMGHYNELENAKKAAEEKYGHKIKWEKTKKGLRSPDLGYVRYYINKIVPKD